jgi:hypothetical protein
MKPVTKLFVYLQPGDNISQFNKKVMVNEEQITGVNALLYLALLEYMATGTRKIVSGFSEVSVEDTFFYVKRIGGEDSTQYLITNEYPISATNRVKAETSSPNNYGDKVAWKSEAYIVPPAGQRD